MKVIFLEEVPGVGRPGEVKEVADGFGRNHLLPKKLAALATPQEIRRSEAIRRNAARMVLRTQEEMKALAQRLEGATITIRAKVGAKGRLYGSITNGHIAEELSRLHNYQIDKRRIELPEPIRQLGEYKVAVRLLQDVVPTVIVVVEGEGGERAEAFVKVEAAAGEGESATPQETEAASPETQAQPKEE